MRVRSKGSLVDLYDRRTDACAGRMLADIDQGTGQGDFGAGFREVFDRLPEDRIWISQRSWVQGAERHSCQDIECFTQKRSVQRQIVERRKRLKGLRSDCLCFEACYAHWIDSLFLIRALMLSRTLYYSEFL